MKAKTFQCTVQPYVQKKKCVYWSPTDGQISTKLERFKTRLKRASAKTCNQFKYIAEKTASNKKRRRQKNKNITTEGSLSFGAVLINVCGVHKISA